MQFFILEMLNISGYVLSLLPLLAAWYLLLCRRRGMPSTRFLCSFLAFALYLGGVGAVTGLPSLRYLTFDPAIRLMPFRDFTSDTLQYLLNIVLFLPAGFLLPLIWEKYAGLKQTARFGFLLSLLIECSQLFCHRTTDLNDLLMNTLGAALGWLAWSRLTGGRSLRESKASPWHAAAMVWFAALFLEPIVSDFLWSLLP